MSKSYIQIESTKLSEMVQKYLTWRTNSHQRYVAKFYEELEKKLESENSNWFNRLFKIKHTIEYVRTDMDDFSFQTKENYYNEDIDFANQFLLACSLSEVVNISVSDLEKIYIGESI